MVSENQQKALESLLADIQGAQMSPRRKALYSLMFFMFLVILYWTGLWLVESLLSLKESLTGKTAVYFRAFILLLHCNMFFFLKKVTIIQNFLLDELAHTQLSLVNISVTTNFS